MSRPTLAAIDGYNLLPSELALLAFAEKLLALSEQAAPLEAFGEAHDELRHAGLAPPVLAHAEELYRRALHMREVVSEHRRREIELGVLIDTAADLSALHDINEVLAAICQRVRSLLRTDAAWITLVDRTRGDTYHCMTDGILSDEPVRKFRLTAGTGLGGLVLETGIAAWTDDYLADQRFAHSPQIDRSARDEGFSAMLGAPMKRGDELLGIIITGNRGQRRFANRDVTLLQTLANHAAIAIANARTLSETVVAVSELREANTTIRRSTSVLERSEQLHKRLSRLVLEGVELSELLDAVAELLDGHVRVLDSDRRVVAVAGPPLDDADRQGAAVGTLVADGLLPAGLATALERVQTLSEAVVVEGTETELPRLVAPMLARAEPLGALVLTRASLEDGDVLMLESAALSLALFLANAHAQARAERVVRGELLDDLIGETTLRATSLARRAQQLGWDPNREHVLVLVDVGEDDTRWLRLRASRLASASRGLMTEHDDTLVLLLPGDSAQAIGVHVARELRQPDRDPVMIAVGRPVTGVQRVAESHREARQTLRIALALGQRGGTVLTEQGDAYGILFGSAKPDELKHFIDRTLGPLIAHDRERGSELIATLEAWFEHDGNMVSTAKAAFVHVNTLYKRLERVDGLLGEGWRRSDERLQIQLALRLRRLAALLDETSPLGA